MLLGVSSCIVRVVRLWLCVHVLSVSVIVMGTNELVCTPPQGIGQEKAKQLTTVYIGHVYEIIHTEML